MTQKQKNIKMHLFYCLMQLLLECLDELKVTNPRMIELKNNMSKNLTVYTLMTSLLKNIEIWELIGSNNVPIYSHFLK